MPIATAASICPARRDGSRLLLMILAATVLLPRAVTASDNGWFSDRCNEPVGAFPQREERQLLRVLSSPVDAGEDLLLLRRPDGQLYGPRALFERLGIAPPAPPRQNLLADWYPLDGVAGLRYAVNRCDQTLSIDASALQPVSRHELFATRGTTVAAFAGEAGGFVQTDLQYLHSRVDDTLSGLVDAGVFSAWGLGRSSLLHDGERSIRLDTQWTYDAPASLQRWRLGDAIARGGRFGRALRFGGVQWGTEFALQPDLITFPLPGFGGVAALPSAVDVYVNNSLRSRQDVPAGPFQFSRIPVLTGGGQVQLVVTDLLGRTQVFETDFYAASQLLRAGLDDYSVEAGADRQRYGLASDDYGRGFVAGTWRRGLNDALTGEVHAESDGRRHVAGVGYSALVPPLGVLSGGVAAGSGDNDGTELSFSVERAMPQWSYGASHVRTSRRLLRVGEIEPASLSRSLVRGSRQFAGLGSLSLAWLQDRGVDGIRLRGLSVGASARTWRSVSVSVGGFHDVDDGQRDSVYLSLSGLFGTRTSAYSQLQHAGGEDFARLGVQRGRLDTIGWDGGAYVDRGASERVGGNLQWTAPRAVLSADVEDNRNDDALRLGLRTGLVGLGRDVFWTRPSEGPFAVIETDSERRVRVYDENRLAGSSSRAAPLLVTDLQPYQPRQIAVADEDYGIEIGLDEITRRVTMPGYGGVRVRFTENRQPTRRLLLRRADNTPPPAGSSTESDGLPPSFTGRQGEALISAAVGAYTLRVRWDGGGCEARIELRETDSLAATPDVVSCAAMTPAPTPAGPR